VALYSFVGRAPSLLDGVMSTAPVFEALEPGTWRATPLARGPFAGVHGGSVAGLMAAAIEASAGAASGARALSLRADFLRPTPVGVPLVLSVTPVQVGRRLLLLDATVVAEGRLTARCSMTLATEMEVTALAEDFCTETPPPPPDPESLPLRPGTAAHGGPWIMDVLQGRRAPDGAVWFRWSVPLIPGGVSPFVAALGPADFAHGLARPGQPGPSPVPAAHEACSSTSEAWLGWRCRWTLSGPILRWWSCAICSLPPRRV
jgi:acyl-coenzyme A thioesterase PaaI-like protein